MKVELENLRLATTALTGAVCVGVPAKDNRSFTHQQDVTNDFRKAVIEVFGGAETTISSPEGKWKVRVEKLVAK